MRCVWFTKASAVHAVVIVLEVDWLHLTLWIKRFEVFGVLCVSSVVVIAAVVGAGSHEAG